MKRFPLPKGVTDPSSFALFSDGACRGNPGPGAWGCMGQDHTGRVVFEASGAATHTTNNRMEMAGVLEGLKALADYLHADAPNAPVPLETILVAVYSDSKYLVDGMNRWVQGWQARGWKKKNKTAPENLALWQELQRRREMFGQMSFHWVKGHAGHPQNEHCDLLANQALDKAGY